MEYDLADHASRVRAVMDEQYSRGDHHPTGERYTPAAHRHYARWRALADRMSQLSFRTSLDVGCAEGFFMDRVRSAFQAEAWGVDISGVAVAKMRRRLGLEGAAADGERLPFTDGSFDLVYSTEVIEHVAHPALFVEEMSRVSRGMVIVTTPITRTEGFRPDLDLVREGHIHAFDESAIRRLFGPEACYFSLRCNASYELFRRMGRHLGPRLSRPFIELDYWTSQHLGSYRRRPWFLRNRDWLVVAPARGKGDGQPRWVCPQCHGELDDATGSVCCSRCQHPYATRDGVLQLVA